MAIPQAKCNSANCTWTSGNCIPRGHILQPNQTIEKMALQTSKPLETRTKIKDFKDHRNIKIDFTGENIVKYTQQTPPGCVCEYFRAWISFLEQSKLDS